MGNTTNKQNFTPYLNTDTVTIRIRRRHQYCTRTVTVVCRIRRFDDMNMWLSCRVFVYKQVVNAIQ